MLHNACQVASSAKQTKDSNPQAYSQFNTICKKKKYAKSSVGMHGIFRSNWWGVGIS